MLVLSRKKNESIIINDDITIVVVEIRGDKVRLGVEAPKEVPVHRNEVYEAIRRNQGPEQRTRRRAGCDQRGGITPSDVLTPDSYPFDHVLSLVCRSARQVATAPAVRKCFSRRRCRFTPA